MHHLVQSMTLMGFGGARLVADTLARAGWRVSRETVRRYGRKPMVTPPSAPTLQDRTTEERVVRAKRPNHVWMMDITEAKGLFGLVRFSIVSALDVFSRRPLLTRAFVTTPTAADTATLFHEAAQAHGAPRHLVTDQGGQFTGEHFASAVERLGVRQRFGRIGQSGSIALIERFWKTLKGYLPRGFLKPLVQEDIDATLALATLHYTDHRPHRGLGGATPAEAFAATTPAHRTAVSPPRGRPGAYVGPTPMRIDFLDPEAMRFPILVKTAA